MLRKVGWRRVRKRQKEELGSGRLVVAEEGKEEKGA